LEKSENSASIVTMKGLPAFVTNIDNLEDKEKPKKIFQVYDSGCAGLVFIRVMNDNIDLFEFAEKIFQSLPEKSHKCRYLMRMIPIQNVCPATTSDLIKNMTNLINTSFKKNDTYCIRIKKRNNTVLPEKENIIKDIGALIPYNKADLKNPDLIIIVEVIKSVVCLSIVRNASKWKNFNLAAHQK